MYRNVPLSGASHVSFDDPIIWPRQSGMTHLHAFYGNTTTDAQSDPALMHLNGNSTCAGGIANRTGYWTPPIIYHCPTSAVGCDPLQNGKVIIPRAASFYYKTEALAGSARRSAQWFPPGFRFVAGDPTADAPNGIVQIDCWRTDSARTATGPAADAPMVSTFDHIPTAAEAASMHLADPNQEPKGWGCNELVVRILVPHCWDGQNLYLPSVGGIPAHMTFPVSGLCSDPAFPVPFAPVGPNFLITITKANLNSATSAADVLALMAPLDYWKLSSDQPEHTNTTQAGSTSSAIKLAASESLYLPGGLLTIGTTTRRITAWDATNKIATVSPAFPSTPSAGTTYYARSLGGRSAHFDWANGWLTTERTQAGSTTTQIALSKSDSVAVVGGSIFIGPSAVQRTITSISPATTKDARGNVTNLTTRMATLNTALTGAPATGTPYVVFPIGANTSIASQQLNFQGAGMPMTDFIRAVCWGVPGLTSSQGWEDGGEGGRGHDCHEGGLGYLFNDGVAWGLRY